MSRAALVLSACASAFLGACVDRQALSPSSGQRRGALLCGLPSGDAPPVRPLDPCRDGSLVLGPHRFVRGQGRPAVETLFFDTAAEMQGCVSILGGGSGRHRVSSAWIDLDGQRIAGPGLFNQNVITIEKRTVLSAGAHTLAARLRGPPETWLEVSVYAGGDGSRHALVSSDHLKLFNLFAEPATFHGAVEPTRLTASGTAFGLSGLPSGNHGYLVRWRFEILSVHSCAVVRTLAGQTLLGASTAFAPQAYWDGLDGFGLESPEGTYAYRLVADLVRVSPSGETVVDSLTTALQTVTLERIRGWVDFHTHPMSHLGFGEKAMHGAPDLDLTIPAGNLSCNPEPLRASTIDQALGNCNGTHGGWGLDNTCGDYLRAALVNYAIDADFAFKTGNIHGDHQHAGYPDLSFWPHQTSILHQQMWWEWLKRAYDGGLRVVVALTVNNELLAEILNGTAPYDDRRVAERQIEETIRMVGRHDFMEVARSSSDLLRIVADHKLAVVLGMEVDRIGNFGVLSLPSEAAIRDEIRHLHALGIRYVFPVHLVDNAFGGSAVYSPLFSFANRRANGYHFLVETSADPDVTYDAGRWGDIPISPGIGNASLTAIHGILVGLGELPAPCIDDISCLPPPGKVRCCGSFQEITNILAPSPELDVYFLIPPGHVNVLGLSPRGEIAVDEMMKLGMIIDLDHMSEKTMERVIGIAEEARELTGAAYPLMFGHSGIRGPNGSERDPPRRLVQRVAALGGMIGAGSAGADSAGATPAGFIASYRRIREVMGPDSVGIGSDANGFVRLPANSEDCVLGADTAGSDEFYGRFLTESGLTTRSSTGNRTWDYVLDCGVAHYGLMPEFLFDIQEFHGVEGREVHQELMRSAVGFVRMWQQIEEASARLE